MLIFRNLLLGTLTQAMSPTLQPICVCRSLLSLRHIFCAARARVINLFLGHASAVPRTAVEYNTTPTNTGPTAKLFLCILASRSTRGRRNFQTTRTACTMPSPPSCLRCRCSRHRRQPGQRSPARRFGKDSQIQEDRDHLRAGAAATTAWQQQRGSMVGGAGAI